MPEIVGVEITKKLPAKAVAASTYRIEGSVKLLDAVGAPPFVYAKIRHKEWFKPEAAEEVNYSRGWPVPITGGFSLDFKPDKEGEYQVTVVATPALIPLPVVGVMPTLAESEVMAVSVGQAPPAVFRFSEVAIDGHSVHLGDHDADSQLLLQKQTSDYLEVLPSFEWVGPRKTITISIQAGYRDFVGTFRPKTDAYTQTVELPESPDAPYSGSARETIKIPLTAAGDISNGAIAMVAKIAGGPDYISRIWNVFATKVSAVSFRFSDITIDGNNVILANHDADSRLLLKKTTSDYLDVTPGFQWQGPKKTATISIKAGYKDITGGFSPKTGAYTRNIDLPESIGTTYSAEVASPIRIPLTAAGGLDDGAIELVLKIAGEPDYISHIWNVYATKETAPPGETVDFDLPNISASPSQANPGQTVNIRCPVISRSTKSQSATAKVYIYEGSILPGHGTLLDTKTVNFSISPGQQYDVSVNYVAAVGTIDRRDVGIEIYVGGASIKSNEWDDVFYVTQPEQPPTPPKADIQNFDFMPTKGTYKIGDKVPFTARYEYKGKKQSGQLVLSTGTGVTPTFFKVQDYSPMSVPFDEAMVWTAETLSGTFVLTSALEPGKTYNVQAKLETLEDRTQEIDTDWSVIVIASVQVGVSFKVAIWGIPDFGSYQYWSCSYWDPVLGAFVGDQKWHNSYDKISFSNVEPGGYLAVFLKRNSTVSKQYTSPVFQASNGGSYTYDVQMGRVYG